MSKFRGSVRALSYLVGLLAVACGSETAPDKVEVINDSGTPDGGACTPEPCTCGVSSGLRSCLADGGLGTCQCTAPQPVLDAGASDNECWAGLYLGNFEGSAGFIIPTTPVTGLDFAANKPALQITLQAPQSASEFVVIGNGVMRGNANGTFPFEANITGELDCQKKEFTATMVGFVQLFLDGIRNDFTGTMTSRYDATSHTLTEGMWTVTGTLADGGSDLGLVGSGTWTANYTADAGAGDGGASDAGAGDAAP